MVCIQNAETLRFFGENPVCEMILLMHGFSAWRVVDSPGSSPGWVEGEWVSS
jgi:hypothetical protein